MKIEPITRWRQAENRALAASLREHLGPGYEVRYPRMPDEDEPDYQAWRRAIIDELAELAGRDTQHAPILVGPSIGASVLARMLADGEPAQSPGGVFLVSAPFWHDDEFWHWDEVRLPDDAAARMPPGLALRIYHGIDDEFVPVAHANLYAKALPRATVIRLPGRNHQFNDDLKEVARDIRTLQ